MKNVLSLFCNEFLGGLCYNDLKKQVEGWKMKHRQIIGLTLAGLLMVNSSSFILSADAAASQVPSAAVTTGTAAKLTAKVLTAQETNTDGKLINLRLDIPKVEGLSDTAYQTALNQSIRDKAAAAQAELEKLAQEQYDFFAASGWEYRPMELYIDYELKSEQGILSFIVTTYAATGGTGMPIVDCYNIDLQQSRSIQLKELFKAGIDYKAAVNDAIRQQISQQEAEMGKLYFEGEEGFNGITEDQGFYIQDGSLGILFPKYSIGPGYLGSPEFKIPLYSMADLLQSKGLEDRLTLKTLNQALLAGKTIALKQPVYFNQAGKVMVSLRQTAEALGYRVTWNPKDNSVSLTKEDQQALVKLSEEGYSYNNAAVKLGKAPEVKDSTTFVSMDFFSKVLKLNAGILDYGIAIDEN